MHVNEPCIVDFSGGRRRGVDPSQGPHSMAGFAGLASVSAGCAFRIFHLFSIEYTLHLRVLRHIPLNDPHQMTHTSKYRQVSCSTLANY